MSGFVLWFTGLSASGKTTIASNVAPELERRGLVVDHLDGDIVRTHLSKGLGYSKEDRDVNIGRIAWVATPIEECARRDPKGLYAKAFSGELADFTGVSAPYEAPIHPELRLDTVDETPAESAATVLACLAELELVALEEVA